MGIPTQNGRGTSSKFRLLTVKEFQKETPINLRWAIQQHYPEMVEAGALLKYGRKLLIEHDSFWRWLLEKGQSEASI